MRPAKLKNKDRFLAKKSAARNETELGCQSGKGFEEAADDGGGVLTEFAVVGTESGEEVAVNVEFADDFSVHKNRDDDLGFCFERAGEIARVAVDVIHNDRLSGGSGGPADALIERNARVGRERADKGTEDEDFASGFVLEHVKADPIVSGEFFVKEICDFLHEVVGGRAYSAKRIDFRDQVGTFESGRGHTSH